MKELYIDCTNGISGDMLLAALKDVGADEKYIKEQMQKANLSGDYHRSYKNIKKIIETSDINDGVKVKAVSIYKVIGLAESRVHGETLDTVHFHEVGREEAVRNVIGIASAINDLAPDRIWCSPLHDGTGTIECSHGTIPVPVPAVTAMKEQCDYKFVQEDVETEMVTPSGLGVLIGIGAVYAEKKPEGKPAAEGEGKGSRDTGRTGGLQVMLYK